MCIRDRCWWHHERISPNFFISSFSFAYGWQGYGDYGIVMNRSAAKRLIYEAIRQGCFIEYISRGGFVGAKGFYTNCDVSDRKQYIWGKDHFCGDELAFFSEFNNHSERATLDGDR